MGTLILEFLTANWLAVLAVIAMPITAIILHLRNKRARKKEIRDAHAPAIDKITNPDWPLIDNLPAAARKIVGRDDKIAALAQAIEAQRTTVITGYRENLTVARGPGGIGKTELATEYARRHKSHYEGVWRVPAETLGSLHQSLADLGSKLDCTPLSTPKETAKDVLRTLGRRGPPWLIIYDNVPAQAQIADYLVPCETVQYLLTSRSAVWEHTEPFIVDVLNDEAAKNLLLTMSERDDLDHPDLLELLGGYPLALLTAASYLKQRPGISVKGYLADFEKRLEDALADGSYAPSENADYPPSIFGSVSLSIDQLSDVGLGLLSLAAYLSPDDIWPDMIAEGALDKQDNGAHDWPGFVVQIAQTSTLLDEALAELCAASLLEIGDGKDQYYIHRLTQSVMRARLGDEGTVWADAAARIVNANVPDIVSQPSAWALCERLAPHALHLLSYAPPSIANNRLMGQIGTYFRTRGDNDTALGLSLRAIEISSDVNGPDSITHAINLNNLGGVYEDMGQYDKAERAYKASHDIEEDATSLNNLAGLYMHQKVYAKAEPYLKKSKALDLDTLGDRHPDYAISLANLGSLYDEWGLSLSQNPNADSQAQKYISKGRELEHQALEITCAAHGLWHQDTATRFNNIAIGYYYAGEIEAARSSMRRGFLIRRDLLGEDHADTQNSHQALKGICGSEPAFAEEMKIWPAELGAIQAEHLHWAQDKLKTLAVEYKIASEYDLPAIGEAAMAKAKQLKAEGAPTEKHQWPLTDFQGALFGLKLAAGWGLLSDADMAKYEFKAS